jgi:integrase
MPKQDRIKTKYPGVYYVDVENKGRKERIYYIRYRFKGKLYEEKAGFQFADDMTAAKAAGKRADRQKGKESSNNAHREKIKASRLAEAGKMNLTRLWDEYEQNKADSKAINTDKGRFEKYLLPEFGNKEPHKIIRLDADRLRIRLLKTLKPQTVKHVFGLLKRIVNFGVSRQLCGNLNFIVETVKVDNQKTEDLNPEQLKNLLTVIDNSTDIEAANIMRLALYTGMRRGEMFKLKWNDIDFQRGFIAIRNPKGGVSQKIPLNDQARKVLENHTKTEIIRNNKKEISEYVFLRPDGEPFTDIRRRVNPIKKAAGIPDDFRALHGLRHSYASMLASSGKVDLYTIQKLLTHKSPLMTQRYAHLRDAALRDASTLAGQIIEAAINSNVIEMHKEE